MLLLRIGIIIRAIGFLTGAFESMNVAPHRTHKIIAIALIVIAGKLL